MPAEDYSAIHCQLDELLAERGMTLTELSRRVGVSLVNLSVLKNNRAKAIRFSTLTALCEVLECGVGQDRLSPLPLGCRRQRSSPPGHAPPILRGPKALVLVPTTLGHVQLEDTYDAVFWSHP